MSKPGVMIYFDIIQPLQMLTDAECGELFRLILLYASCGECFKTSEKVQFAWAFVKPLIDRDSAKYFDTSRKNQYKVYVRECKKENTTPVDFEEWEKLHPAADKQQISADINGYPTTITTSATTSTAISTSISKKKKCPAALSKSTIYSDIVSYLNQVCGTSYRASSQATKRLIDARTNEGFSLDDFKVVIENKFREWGNDSKMRQYLRPETLFGTKFEAYLNQRPKQPPQTTSNDIDLSGIL